MTAEFLNNARTKKEALDLIKQGADVNRLNYKGETPLQRQCSFIYGSRAVVEVLIQHGANLHVRDKNGATLFHLAVVNDHPSIARLLLQKGLDINAQDNNGDTPLHYTVQSNLIIWARYLVLCGADINIKNKKGVQALPPPWRYQVGVKKGSPRDLGTLAKPLKVEAKSWSVTDLIPKKSQVEKQPPAPLGPGDITSTPEICKRAKSLRKKAKASPEWKKALSTLKKESDGEYARHLTLKEIETALNRLLDNYDPNKLKKAWVFPKKEWDKDQNPFWSIFQLDKKDQIKGMGVIETEDRELWHELLSELAQDS